MAPKASKILGIDLGTSNSCMAVIRDGQVQVLKNREGESTTPSVVCFLKGGERLVGRPARLQASSNHADTVFSVKRFMGMKMLDEAVRRDAELMPFRVEAAPNGDAWIAAGGKNWSPPEISAMVLAKLRRDAEEELGETITQAVVTVPAYFSDSQRQATKDAGRIAGLEVQRIINEPTAAALSCGLDARKNLNVVVFDLGGGTFDITVLQARGGVFEVKATNGNSHLGGDDFDQAIIRLLLKSFQDSAGVDLSGDRMALQRLKEAAEAAKIELSTREETLVSLPFLATSPSGPLHLERVLTRPEFNAATAHLVRATLNPCGLALTDARLGKGQIDTVLLVGGMTRVPEIRRQVEAYFGRPALAGVDPDEAVAQGAAIQGGILRGDIRDRLLLDVAPLSLGVRVAGGMVSKLIERNTTVPCRKTAVYSTANDNQTSVRISVYQGEHPMASENIFLGDCELLDIQPQAKGTPQIEVSFDIDANGILRVRAVDKASRRAQNIRIEPNSGLRDEQIRTMMDTARNECEARMPKGEVEQYRTTCVKLLEECRRTLAGEGFAGDRPAAEAWLKKVGFRLAQEDIVQLKETLKELNHFVLRLRLAREVPVGGRDSAVARG
jgi:molecular chaperone DnaK